MIKRSQNYKIQIHGILLHTITCGPELCRVMHLLTRCWTCHWNMRRRRD